MASEKRRTARPKPELAPPSSVEEVTRGKSYTCTHCGSQTRRPDEHFYRFMSPATANNNGYTRVCKMCINGLYENFRLRFDSATLAVQMCCHYLDMPYVEEAAIRAIDHKTVATMTAYANSINTERYHNMLYTDTIAEQYTKLKADVGKATDENREKNWDRESLQNMAYVKNIVGYDPFDDKNYSLDDRKFLFNTMASYCPDSSIMNDSHKLNSILNIVRELHQVNKTQEALNKEMSKSNPNLKVIQDWNNVKKTQLQSIDRMAEKNDVSNSSATKGSTTLTGRMQALSDDSFRDIEVNLYDIEQSAQLQKLADISAKAVIAAIELEDNDYVSMVEEQREIIAKLQGENKSLQEENRILKNKSYEEEARSKG